MLVVVSIVWTVTTYVALLGAWAVFAGAERLPGSTWATRTRLALVAGACAVGLVILGLLYQVEAIAELDGAWVKELADARRDPVVDAFRILTTVGDTVQTMTIAAILAIWLLAQPRSGWWRPVLLPALMLLQLGLQFAFPEVFPVLVLSDVEPDLPVDGSGVIPSGSVARLSSLFVVAWLIYQRSWPGRGRWLLTLGAALVLVEIATRLFLGRHFVADIVGGFLLGGFLICVMAALPGFCSSPPRQPEPQFPRGSTQSG